MTKPEWAYVNGKMPDSVYVVLEPSYFKRNPIHFQGSFIRLTGVINLKENKLLGVDTVRNRLIHFDVDFIPKEVPEFITNKTSIEEPAPIPMCKVNPQLCNQKNSNNKNYALIYSGGIDDVHAHTRYWNNIKFMYLVLKSQFGYTDDQIIVVYKDGVADDNDDNIHVDYPANEAGLNNAFSELNTHLNGNNDFLFFMTNHGGGYDENDKSKISGLPDINPKDEIDKYHYDETNYYFHGDVDDIRDDWFAEKINNLHFKKMICLFQQCYGGGFLYDLRGKNRVLMSASSEFGSSYGEPSLRFDEFCNHFIAALNRATYDGIPVDSDENRDGRISMLEAFNYAKRNDAQQEKPELEDTGDGRESPSPVATAGMDGWLASITFLDN